MTEQEISHIIKEELSAFSRGQRITILSAFFEKLVLPIMNAYRSHSEEKIDQAETLFALYETYRINLEVSKQDLVSIQLFALIVFGKLEEKARESGNYQLQKTWSDVGHKIIEISLQVNDMQ